MALKHHTIILVPHARAKLRKWRVSNRQIGVFLAILAVLTFSAGYVTWSYLTTRVDRQDLQALRQENQGLRTINSSFESSVQELRTQLAEYEDRTRKLAILAGFETLGSEPSLGGRRDAEVGIGGTETHRPRGSLDSFSELETLGSRAQALGGDLDQVRERLRDQARWVSAVPTITPVKGIMTSGYGNRRDPVHRGRAFHQGLDISATPGAPVHATADGTVTLSRRHGGLGNAVFLSHGYGLATRYGHMARLAVAEGARVKRGEVIGYVGNTGRSTGYHLHYEVYVDGRPTNPIEYILDRVPRR